jgi:hypothetical protein
MVNQYKPQGTVQAHIFPRMSCMHKIVAEYVMRHGKIQSLYQSLSERKQHKKLVLIITSTDAHSRYQNSSSLSYQDLIDAKQENKSVTVKYCTETSTKTQATHRRIQQQPRGNPPRYKFVHYKHAEFDTNATYQRSPLIGEQLPSRMQADKGPTMSSYSD